MADDLNINIGANPAGVEAGSRRAKAALQGVAAGGKDLDAALRRLRTAIDPTFVAMEKYNKVHQDNLTLLRSGLVTRREYNAAMKVAKANLDAETVAIQQNSAAGRAAIAEQRRQKAEALAASRAASVEEARLAREAAAATRQAQREAAAEAKRLKAEQRAADRAAAAEAKALARETARAEMTARREAAAAARAAEREMVQASRDRARQERADARAIADAEKQARREQREAAREAGRVAAAAAKEAQAAKKQEAAASREAAAAARDLARAERQDAAALQELRGAVDPAAAALQRYNNTMARATQLLMQNKLQQGEWNKIQALARAQMDLNVRSMGRQNAMYVQLGYQAQDVTASLASGINPLVILAQQGGQTAAALSTMGGTAGRVAAFFAGPWGAAIIGATMLLGYLWQANSDGEKATKDVMNAEDRRKMSVKELTQAIREYVDAQREANEQAIVGARRQATAMIAAQDEIQGRIRQTEAEIARYRSAMETAMNIPGAMATPAGIAAVGALRAKIYLLERQLTSLRKGAVDASEAATEAMINYATEVATTSDIEAEHQRNITAAQDAYRASNKTAEDGIRLTQALRAEEERYTRAKADEANARRENAREARAEARAIHQSREAAIQALGNDLIQRGYSPNMENFGVGNRRVGEHPGMGRSAHGRYAIDVNIPGAGVEADNPVYRQQMDQEVLAAQAAGYRVLWNGKIYEPHGGGPTRDIPLRTNQHRNHAHIEAPESIVGKPAGTALAESLVQAEERWAEEQRRIREEATRDRVAELNFQQELNQEDMAQVLAYQAEKIAALTEFYGAQSKEVMDANREQVRMQRAHNRQITEDQRKNMDQRVALAEAEAERVAAAQDASREGRGGVIDLAENNGIISPAAAITARAALLDEEYSQQVAHEARMYQLKADNIRAQLALENLTPNQRRDLNMALETAEADHLGRMQELQLTYARNVQDVYARSATLTLQKWREIGTTLSSSMTSAFQGIWTHQQSLQDAFIATADNLVYKFVDMGAKMFEEWFMRQVGMTAVQTAQDGVRTASAVGSQAVQTAAAGTGAAARTGIEAGAGAAQTGIIGAVTTAAVAAEGVQTAAALAGATAQTGAAAAAGMSEVGTSAAVAAAGAYKSTVVIPFIGPIAAPAAAALALAAVMGFGALISARGGQGEVPEDGQLSVLHKKEMVLPAQFATPLRQMLISPRSSQGLMGAAAAAGTSTREASMTAQNSVNFHYQPKHTNMGAGFDELLRQDGRSLRRWIKNEMRNGGLTLK